MGPRISLVATLAAITLFGCSTLTLTPRARAPAQISQEDYYNSNQPLAVIPDDQYLNYNDFKNFLVSQPISTIEEALPPLVKKYPDYFHFHLLAYASLSVHESSFEEPRAVVFGPDARFILTFNGNPKQRAGSTIEIAQYSQESHSFSFREVLFKKENLEPDTGLDPDEIEFQNERIIISKPNPQRCQMCHGSNATPIFMTYFTWPGFYGSNDDNLFMQFNKSAWNPNNAAFFSSQTEPHSQGRMMVLDGKDTEFEGFVRYIKGKYQHSRYKWLPKQFGESAIEGYLQGKKLPELDLSAEAAAEQKKYHSNMDWPHRPNLIFQTALMRLNQDRIIYRLKRLNLENAFKCLDWESLQAAEQTAANSTDPIGYMATQILDVISKAKFKNGTPSLTEVRAALETNVRDEILVLREKISFQAQDLKPSTLRLFWYPGEPPPTDKIGSFWVGSSEPFFMKLLGLKKMSEVDKIAFHYEADDQVMTTALAVLLAGYGIDLHDYSMNLRQKALAFHEGGLTQVFAFLGIPISG